MKPSLFLLLFMLSVQGCSYAISRDMAGRADKTLSFELLQADPDSYKGKILILGGTIVQSTDTSKGTILEVSEQPLDYWGKPKRTERTGGRFLLTTSVHLNTMLFAPGRQITAAAEVAGMRSRALGETEYSYPVVISRELKLWPRERQGWDKPQWVDPLNRPSGPPQNPSQSTW